MEKLRTLYGSPSSSMVNPFLMSDVSTATLRAVDDERWVVMMVGAKAAEVTIKVVKMASFMVDYLLLRFVDKNSIYATLVCSV